MSDEFYFNPEQQEGSDFELIPPGDYVAQIIEAEIRQPKSGDGHMLALTWKICEGEYENRQVWDTLCYQHSNVMAQDIARRRLKDICTAFDITEQVAIPKSSNSSRRRYGSAFNPTRTDSLMIKTASSVSAR